MINAMTSTTMSRNMDEYPFLLFLTVVYQKQPSNLVTSFFQKIKERSVSLIRVYRDKEVVHFHFQVLDLLMQKV